MSSGGLHLGASLALATGIVLVEQYDVRPLEVGVVALAGGLGPDVDTGRSAVGSLVPQWIAPDIERSGFHGRNWFHVLPIRHRGVLHWPLTGLVFALLIRLWWSAANHAHFFAVWPLDFGLVLAATFFGCWLLHRVMDDPRWMR